jgi:alkylation response protein AidB-like acyl-CoA dehydrogenase
VRLDLDDDQALFHETSARFIQSELPLTATRGVHELPAGFERPWLRKVADLGWFAMLVPEDLGGGSVSGNGIVDLSILAELQGADAQPGPLIPMNLVAHAIARHGSEALQATVLEGIVSGTTVATFGFADERGVHDHGAGVPASRADGRVILNGTRGFVQSAVEAGELLVAATLDGGPALVLVPGDAPGLRSDALAGLDLGRRFAHVQLHDVAVDDQRVVAGGASAIDELLQLASVLTVADTVGAMHHLFEMTVAYAKDRVAFGRPIGSFQAIKHALADQAVHLESCKAVAVAACDAVAAGRSDAAEVVSMAAAYVGDQANELAQVCLQVHGGIGYTWEHDLHLLMRRIQTNSVIYGEPTWHREQVCRVHGLAAEEVAS